MRKPTFFALTLATLSLLASGCSTHRAFTYPLEPISIINSDPPDIRIAVLPANDLRRIKNSSAALWLYLIPLMPGGWVNYERPEAANFFATISRFDANIDEDIPKAIAQHWKRAGLAKNVFFDYGGMVETADYYLETDIRDTRYKGWIYTYGLSVFGPLLWILGLPASNSDVTVILDMKLRDQSDEVIWSETLSESWETYQGLYYNWGRDMEGLARALQSGLSRTARQHPIPFLQ